MPASLTVTLRKGIVVVELENEKCSLFILECCQILMSSCHLR